MPQFKPPEGTTAEEWTILTTNTGPTPIGTIPANTAIYYNARIQREGGGSPTASAYRYVNINTNDIIPPPQVTPIKETYESIIKSANDRELKRVTSTNQISGQATLSSISQTNANKPRDSYPTSYYPRALETTKQDRIRFSMVKLGTRNISSSSSATGRIARLESRTQVSEPLGTVYLGVPNQITDSNSADWSGATMGPIQTSLAAIAIEQMSSSENTDVANLLKNTTGEVFKNLKNFAREKGNQQALQILLAQEAVQAQGLLSRVSGAVANPNLELLFNGPSLRPFSFNFRMSPRDDFEASQVKQIIRFFKEGMAVQTTDQDIFLKSPNVFDIQFQSGNEDGNPHRSLPRIKTCALIGCDVDYTPDGSYMTFDDPNNGYPMTCYQMTLRFNELEPVYARDYKNVNENDIGY
jgi:hypothetical protein